MTEGVAEKVAVSVGEGDVVAVTLVVGVLLGDADPVTEAERVTVDVTVLVRLTVAEYVGDNVTEVVAVGVAVRVGVTVSVGETVADRVTVWVAVEVTLLVDDTVGVTEGVGLGLATAYT